MPVNIKCPHCKLNFDWCGDYAQHIIVKHSGDKERKIWAENTLKDLASKKP
jgi:uncharacterized C2H2 Zn-finger protein